ncbi:phosphotransferase [Actinomadura barringtoniae]|uniref:Phosphotransferase n=1 Tax=Actinomadura barringtoniae TaxID=1427535 RepID=A0A939TC41_9ACTN|nr:phosphotransferase [Actinomadura barringtoniae]MBO2450850.1 phosphotransferase [Actinomadura barringtoniae]
MTLICHDGLLPGTVVGTAPDSEDGTGLVIGIRGRVTGDWSRILREHYDIRWSARTALSKHHGEHHFIRTLRQRYVLSSYAPSVKVPPFRKQFEIIRALQEAGFSLVHSPVDTVDGEPVVEGGERGGYWLLRNFTRHDGYAPWHCIDVVADAARTLASLHQAGEDCTAPVVGPEEAEHALNWSVTTVVDNFDVVLSGFQHEQLAAGERDEIRRAVDMLLLGADKVLWASEEAGLTGLTHGDYRPANVLVRKGVVVNVIDWERARHDHHLQDAVFAALQFMVSCPCSCQKSGRLELARRFMDVYLKARAIDQPEVVAWMFRFVVLRRLLLNGRTEERLRLFRSPDFAKLADSSSWS